MFYLFHCFCTWECERSPSDQRNLVLGAQTWNQKAPLNLSWSSVWLRSVNQVSWHELMFCSKKSTSSCSPGVLMSSFLLGTCFIKSSWHSVLLNKYCINLLINQSLIWILILFVVDISTWSNLDSPPSSECTFQAQHSSVPLWIKLIKLNCISFATPELLHSQKTKQKVGVCSAVVDVRLK